MIPFAESSSFLSKTSGMERPYWEKNRYGGDLRLGKILGIFTGLAFFVSCLGLFGLALFASEQRKKEIGLRRVNGSGIGQMYGY